MKFPLSWLQSYFSQDLESEKVIDAFFSVGLEVDQVIELGKDLDLVIKAKVESFVSHPDADSLSLCQVNTGQEVLSIVCGAKNFVAGDFVALAMIGAKLPNGLKIKKSKIRGQESFGMLCSESELGLAETSEGILIIPADDQNPLGEPIAKVLGLEDIQIELELTPNRGDCLSIEGLVREVAASLELSSKIQGSESRGENNHSIEVEIEEPEACPRYSLHRLSDIAVQSSTSLVQRRLERCGVRSIDHVVDITNYVMLEMGQPMHAFDADKVIGGIRVRYAKEGENLLCLDDIERVLDPADLIIADDEGPLALAGVMGGQRSSVDQNTKNILLESAHFDPSVVRLSSKRHHISTESSRRFERVVDPCLSWSAASRAVEMLIEYGAKVEKKIDVIKGEFQAREIFLRKSKIQKILGADLEDAGQILSRLGFSLSKMDEGWMVRVPTRRPDLEREIDLIEEVARLTGFDQLPSTLPPLLVVPSLRDQYAGQNKLAAICSSYGLLEAKTYSFESKEQWQCFAGEQLQSIEVANPLNHELQYMKSSHIPSLLKVLSFNQSKHTASSQAFFELGPVYHHDGKKTQEPMVLAAVWSGAACSPHWKEGARDYDFFDAKGFLEFLEIQLKIKGQITLVQEELSQAYHPGQSAKIVMRNQEVGLIAALHPRVCKTFSWPQSFVFEMKAQFLIDACLKKVKTKEISSYPSVVRDLAFVVKQSVQAQSIQDAMSSAKVKNLTEVTLFDFYQGKPLSENEKSLGFRLSFSSLDRTLKDQEVDQAIEKIVSKVEMSCQAKLR